MDMHHVCMGKVLTPIPLNQHQHQSSLHYVLYKRPCSPLPLLLPLSALHIYICTEHGSRSRAMPCLALPYLTFHKFHTIPLPRSKNPSNISQPIVLSYYRAVESPFLVVVRILVAETDSLSSKAPFS